MSKVLKNKNSILALLALTFLFTYLIIAANTVRGEYNIEDLKKDIAEAKKESNELQLRLSEVSSLEFVLEESERLSYDNVDSVSYLKKPSDSPFASR